MSDKNDDDIIFEKSSEVRVAELRAQLIAERTFEIEFVVKNDKIQFSHSQSEVSLRWIANGIIDAVQTWEVEHIEYVGRGAHALNELGAPQIRYEHIVVVDWVSQKIRTSLRQGDGQLFLTVMAYFVEHFRGGAPAAPVN